MDEDSDVGQKVQFAYDTVLGFQPRPVSVLLRRTIVQLSDGRWRHPLSGYLYVFDVPAEAIGEPLYVTDDVTDPKRRFDRLCAARPDDRGEQKSALRADPLPARSSALEPELSRKATVTALQASLALSHREDSQARRRPA
jgi:hypothetical protein